MSDEMICRVCGCTDYDACEHPVTGTCSWVEVDLCSTCADAAAEEQQLAAAADAQAAEEAYDRYRHDDYGYGDQ